MLYLIKDRDYIKIGYTSNLDQRQKAYETTNCYAEVIMTKGRIARFFHPVTISRYELLPAEFHFSRNKHMWPSRSLC